MGRPWMQTILHSLGLEGQIKYKKYGQTALRSRGNTYMSSLDSQSYKEGIGLYYNVLLRSIKPRK